MMGYLNDTTTTQIAFTNDGWFMTGDLSYVNDKDQWFIVDRKKVLRPCSLPSVASVSLNRMARTYSRSKQYRSRQQTSRMQS